MAIIMWGRIVLAVLTTLGFSVVAIMERVLVRTPRTFHGLARGWARSVMAIFGVSVTVEGAGRVEPGKTYIYVSNHASMFDIPAVLGWIPDQVHIMLKKELTRVPIWGWLLAISPYIVIDRRKARSASDTLGETSDAIKQGKSVLIFAEGTRTHTGDLLPFKRGAFSVAARAGVPIVPVTINNTYAILQKGSLNVRPAPIQLLIGEPIATEGCEGREAEQRLMDETRRQIESTYVAQSLREGP